MQIKCFQCKSAEELETQVNDWLKTAGSMTIFNTLQSLSGTLIVYSVLYEVVT